MLAEWPGLTREQIAGLANDYLKSCELVHDAAQTDFPDNVEAAMAHYTDLRNQVRVQLLVAVLDLGCPPEQAEQVTLAVLRMAERHSTASGNA